MPAGPDLSAGTVLRNQRTVGPSKSGPLRFRRAVKSHSEQIPGETGPSHRLQRPEIVLLVAALLALLAAGTLSCPPSRGRPWPAGSILEKVVWLASLGYRWPTLRGIEVKTFLVSLLTGAVLIWAAGRTIRRRSWPLHSWHETPAYPDGSERISLARASMWAALVLIGWAAASICWSPDLGTAVGAVWVLSMPLAWAIALTLHGHRGLARPLSDVLLAAAGVTAGLSLWYWLVRAEETRLGWPMGNPLSLASVMVPAVLVGAGRLGESASLVAKGRADLRGALRLCLHAVALGVTLTALWATGSRGALLAVAGGAVAGGWTACNRRTRAAFALAALVAGTLAVPAVTGRLLHAGAGRDASARMRLYAWRQAVQLASGRPATGRGAGAYTLLATGATLRVNVTDPLAMSGEILAHAHSEPLELLCEAGAVGLTAGLAVWALAFAAAAAKASGADRLVAAGVAGAVVAVFLDAASGVSWRLPGPGPFMATPLALAWMMWREPNGRIWRTENAGLAWPAIAAGIGGLAVALAGAADFAGARCLYRAQVLASKSVNESPDAVARAIRLADLARRLRLDPPRRLAAWKVSGGVRLGSARKAVLRKPAEPAELARADQQLDEGLEMLQQLQRVGPGWGDVKWQIAELQNAKSLLARRAGDEQQARRWRHAALATAIEYLTAHPLDAKRIWRLFSRWPEVGAGRKLLLFRGILRDEGQVWLGRLGGARPAEQHWLDRWATVTRLWHALGNRAESVAQAMLNTGYAGLQTPYADWPDPLICEGLRLVAWREVLAGRPAEAADILAAAELLYQRAGQRLPYSAAAARMERAACLLRTRSVGRARQATGELAEVRIALARLPDNPVKDRLLQLNLRLQQAGQVICGSSVGDEPEAPALAVALFWDMPVENWPEAIWQWARQADEAALRQQELGAVRLALAVDRQSLETALRQAGYRWPWRAAFVQRLIENLEHRSDEPSAG